jgi:hypothetical protein
MCAGVGVHTEKAVLENPDFCRGSGHHHKVLRELSEVDLEFLGILEVVPSQGIEIGKGFSLRSSKSFLVELSQSWLDLVPPRYVVVVFVVAGHFILI